MSKPTIISGRVDADLAARLDLLANRLDRPRGWVVAKATERFVNSQLALIESLDEAEAQIDRGEFSTQEQMEEWFAERCRNHAAE